MDIEIPTPQALRDLSEQVDKKIAAFPTRNINEYGFDPWGYSPRWVKPVMMAMAVVYKYWFRVETTGLEHLPAGRVIVIGNHAGNTFAWDGAMVGTATVLEATPPRPLRGMAEFYLPTIPFFNVFMHRLGSIVGRPENARRLLEADEALMVFPEGRHGFVKTYAKRYKLQQFGHGFMRLALATKSPIVPVAIVGSEEQSPGIATSKALAKLVGAPDFPITPTFPWFGPLGMIPFPAKFHIRFGPPLRFQGDPDDDETAMAAKVEKVKDAIRRMLNRMLKQRKSVWT